MSISSNRLREIVETRIGEGNSRRVFGRKEKELFDVISEEENSLTEEMFEEGLDRCEFKNPEYVGLVSLFCPIIHMEIIDRILGKKLREIYKCMLYIWYFFFVSTIVISIWEMYIDMTLIIICTGALTTSLTLREWSKDYNILELMYYTLREVGKIPG